MPRLPIPGSDDGNWGDILNDFLRQVHTEDGKLKTNTVTAAHLSPGSVTTIAIGDSTVSESKLAQGVKDKLNALASVTGGREVELRTNPSHIQWRYVGDNTWTDLVALTDLQGSAGAKGDKGDSAYELAVAQGFVGTEVEWLASLEGPEGPPGTTTWAGITDKPTEFPPTAHDHDDRYYTENEVDAALAGKSDTGHTHSQYVENTDARLSDARTPTAHSHPIADVTGLQAELDGKQAAGSYAPALGPDDNYVTNAEKASLHSHDNKTALDQVSGVNTGDQTLASLGAAPASHSHDVTDLTATGTRDGTTFLRGDNTWATPEGGGAMAELAVPAPVGIFWHGTARVNTSASMYSNRAFLFPIFLARPVSQMMLNVTAIDEPGDVRFGVWERDPLTGAPGALLVQVTGTLATGEVIVEVPAYTAGPALYIGVAIQESGSATVRSINNNGIYSPERVYSRGGELQGYLYFDSTGPFVSNPSLAWGSHPRPVLFYR